MIYQRKLKIRTVAMCLEMKILKRDNGDKKWKSLYLSYYMLADSLPNIDNDGLLRCNFSKLSEDMQIQLASNFFYFVKFMRKKLLQKICRKKLSKIVRLPGIFFLTKQF